MRFITFQFVESVFCFLSAVFRCIHQSIGIATDAIDIFKGFDLLGSASCEDQHKKVLSPNSNRKEKKYGDPQRNARIVDYHWKSIVKLANIQSCCSLQLTEWLIGDS